MSGRTNPSEGLDATGLTFGVVAARFNQHITEKLVEGARAALAHVNADGVELWVPGAFELPLACRKLAEAPRALSGIVALGCVIRGETAHFDYVAGECARGLMQVQLDTLVPIGFGILTTEDEAQALARAGGEHGNKGYDAAMAAVEMVRAMDALRDAAAER